MDVELGDLGGERGGVGFGRVLGGGVGSAGDGRGPGEDRVCEGDSAVAPGAEVWEQGGCDVCGRLGFSICLFGRGLGRDEMGLQIFWGRNGSSGLPCYLLMAPKKLVAKTEWYVSILECHINIERTHTYTFFGIVKAYDVSSTNPNCT